MLRTLRLENHGKGFSSSVGISWTAFNYNHFSKSIAAKRIKLREESSDALKLQSLIWRKAIANQPNHPHPPRIGCICRHEPWF